MGRARLPGVLRAGAAAQGVLLGNFAARIDRCVRLDAPALSSAGRFCHNSREHVVGTAIFDNFGELCGRALATWIEPASGLGRRREQQFQPFRVLALKSLRHSYPIGARL